MSSTSYKFFPVHKKQFIYTCDRIGEVYFEGFALFKMILYVIKPGIVIDVKDLETKRKSITILKADNKYCTICTYVEGPQQEINA